MCLVILRKERTWEKGGTGWGKGGGGMFYHPLHFMFDFYKGLTYSRPPF